MNLKRHTMKVNFFNKIPGIKSGFLFFLVIFIALSFYYKLDRTMFYRPQSLHAWRQTDCLSITQNYFQRNNSFWEPEIYNQMSDGGLSGKTAGEFPLLYYSVAQLWKLVGKSEFLYRLIVLSISFIGLFVLFKFSKEVLKNNVQALFVSLGLFTSVTYVYYSANFLTNIPAFALVIIAWYFIWIFYKTDKEKFLWIAMLFFEVGILLKVSSGISFVALLGWILIELLRKKEKRILFKKPLRQLIPFIIAIAGVLAWYIYAGYYNKLHQGWYTFNNVWPIWRISNEKIWDIIHRANLITKPAFMHISMYYVLGGMWIYVIATYKKRSVFLNYLLFVIPFGSILYVLLWFQAFDVHDYYWIDLYINVLLVWILFFKTIGTHKWAHSKIVNFVIIGFLLFNVVKCNQLLNSRYSGWKNELYNKYFRAVGELEPILLKHGIGPDDKVISIPDGSINISLYLMNRRGYCNYNSRFDKPGTFQHRINQGAKYLVVNDTSILKDSLIRPFTKYPILTYKNVKIFDLRPFKKR
jgi:hypothetical protein